MKPPKMFKRIRFRMTENMPGKAAKPQSNTRMLNPPAGINQFGTHGTILGLDNVCDHFCEPIRGNNVYIIVEEADDVAAGTFHGPIVHRRIVEGPRIWHDAHTGIADNLIQKFERFWIITLVVDDDDFWVCC